MDSESVSASDPGARRQLKERSGDWTRFRFRVLASFLRAAGVYQRGRSNFESLRVVHTALRIPALPPAIEGLRILLLSDIHLGLGTGTAGRLVAALAGLRYDLVALTGDFLDEQVTDPDWTAPREDLRNVLESLKPPVYAVMGNHDAQDLFGILHGYGVRILDPGVEMRYHHNGESLRIIGIPHSKAPTRPIPESAAAPVSEKSSLTLCLAHSPANYKEALARNAHIYLCGHTHGGQICLPGGLPVVSCCGVPSPLMAGQWRRRGLHGFTTRGVGASGIPVRYFCPPEVVLITLGSR